MTDTESSYLTELIRNAKNGDSKATGELLERYRQYLRFKVDQEIGPKYRKRIDASDVVQITFADACKDVVNFRGETENEFSAWLQKILQNRLNNVFRDQKAAKRDPRKENTWAMPAGGASTSICWFDPAANASTPSQHIIKGERALRIAIELHKLPEAQRDAVGMRHLEGMSLAEIAEEMGRSTTATAGLIKRGVAALRAALQDDSIG